MADAALIAAAQRVEHYEIAAYGSTRAIAEQMDKQEVVDFLQKTLDEEGAADKKLSAIAEGSVLTAAADAGDDDSQEDEDEEDEKATSMKKG